MKRSGLFLFILAVFFSALVVLSWCTHCNAAVTESEVCVAGECQRILIWTTTTGVATVPAYVIGSTGNDKDICGTITSVETDPGGTAPTDNHTLTMVDQFNGDVLGGACSANLDTANTETRQPLIDGTPGWRQHCGKLTLNISANLINNATGTVIVHYFKAVKMR